MFSRCDIVRTSYATENVSKSLFNKSNNSDNTAFLKEQIHRKEKIKSSIKEK